MYEVVRQHLETFLAEARRRDDGGRLPQFVEREFREFLRCGILAHGFARFRCHDCTREILVAFSCKGRGFCPSCCGRRMAELSAHLVDGVLGGLPVRQWVLTLPYRLRYALAWDHRLCRAVLAVFVRALLGFERRRAAQRGARGGVGGAVTAIQRFGSALNTNVHFHTLAVQGVFVETADGAPRFVPSPAPADSDVEALLATVRRRILHLVKHHGIDLEQPSSEDDSGDERLIDYPLYARIQGAAVVGRVATGRRAGARVARIGQSVHSTRPNGKGSLHAHSEGFDLHAAVAVPAGDRKRLEHLCRYVLRPPLAQERMELTGDGKVVLRLRRTWHDGTRAICFEPLELLEKLAAMIPKPRINLIVYHGVFAPHARHRSTAVQRAHAGRREDVSSGGGRDEQAGSPGAAPGVETGSSEAAGAGPQGSGTAPRPPPRYIRPKHYAWADLLQRTFAIDILECPECGGRLRFLAAIETRAVVDKILRHLGLPLEGPAPAPARIAGWLPGVDAGAE